jgi:phage-related protein
MKEIAFLANTLDVIRTFSMPVRTDIGYQLRLVQQGKSPTNWKPIKTIGKGVNEIRTQVSGDIYRTIYITKLEDTIYVLHAFQKKSQKMPKKDIELAKKRLKELMRNKT